MAKMHFQQLLLQSLESQDPSEIILMWWFGAQKPLITINVENGCTTYYYFCGKRDSL